jgi:prophage antirepressor-like protein
MHNNSIQLFNFQENEVRTFTDENNNIWFCLKDICDILELSNPRKVASDLDKDDVTISYVGVKTGVKKDGTDAVQNIEMNFINESGLYQVIFKSRKLIAKKFSKWITSEVIPSIRKTGQYGIENLSRLEILKIALDSEEKRLQLEEENKKLLPKAQIFDDFLESINTISVGELAKLLCKNGYNTGQKRLFKFLRENKILMEKDNLPYQEYIDRGYFEVSTFIINHTHSNYKETKPQTKVTKKGCLFIRNLFIKATSM